MLSNINSSHTILGELGGAEQRVYCDTLLVTATVMTTDGTVVYQLSGGGWQAQVLLWMQPGALTAPVDQHLVVPILDNNSLYNISLRDKHVTHNPTN